VRVTQRRTRLPTIGFALALAALLGLMAALLAPPTRAPATFPGSNGRISFDGVVPGTCCSEIFTAKPNGGEPRRLTSTPGRSDSELPDWSPDGQKIAFDSDRTDIDGRKQVTQVYSMNADGSGKTQLTRGPGEQANPGWSPDGTKLAIRADWGHPRALQGIWIIPASDPDGVTQEEAQRLTRLPADVDFDSEPQFSPDGTSVTFSRFKDFSSSAIFRIGIGGKGLKRLTPWHLNASDPDWSPDGHKITFDSGDSGQPGSKGDIYVIRADGSRRRRLTDFPPVREGEGIVQAGNPVWSPSGMRIMYTHFFSHLPPDKGNVLVRMWSDGSHKHVVVGERFGRSHFPNKVDWGTHP
jgi:Tol biopolymer transport system component